MKKKKRVCEKAFKLGLEGCAHLDSHVMEQNRSSNIFQMRTACE